MANPPYTRPPKPYTLVEALFAVHVAWYRLACIAADRFGLVALALVMADRAAAADADRLAARAEIEDPR